MRTTLLVLAVAFCATLPTPAQEKKEPAKLAGTVDSQTKADLPEGAVATVALQDTSLADAPAKTIGMQKLDKLAKFPFAFAVEYDPAAIQPNRTYTMSVRIEAGGKLVFINDTSTPVLTRGAPGKDVKVLVKDLRK